MRTITQRLLVAQDWFESGESKTGWDTHGWYFELGNYDTDGWDIVEVLRHDKYGNPTLGIAELEIKVRI